MTMLNVVSGKDRIVMSADSCVSSGACRNRDKIFYIPENNVAIMIYEDGDRYMQSQHTYNLNKIHDNLKKIESKHSKIGPIEVAKRLVETANDDLGGLASVINSGSMETGVVVVGYDGDIPTICIFTVQGKRSRVPSGYKNLTGTYDSAILRQQDEPIEKKARVKDAKKDTKIHIFRGNFSMVFATTEGCRVIDKSYKRTDDLEKMSQEEAVTYTRDMLEQAINEFKVKAEEEGKSSHIGEPIDTLVFSKEGYIDSIWNEK